MQRLPEAEFSRDTLLDLFLAPDPATAWVTAAELTELNPNVGKNVATGTAALYAAVSEEVMAGMADRDEELEGTFAAAAVAAAVAAPSLNAI